MKRERVRERSAYNSEKRLGEGRLGQDGSLQTTLLGQELTAVKPILGYQDFAPGKRELDTTAGKCWASLLELEFATGWTSIYVKASSITSLRGKPDDYQYWDNLDKRYEVRDSHGFSPFTHVWFAYVSTSFGIEPNRRFVMAKTLPGIKNNDPIETEYVIGSTYTIPDYGDVTIAKSWPYLTMKAQDMIINTDVIVNGFVPKALLMLCDDPFMAHIKISPEPIP